MALVFKERVRETTTTAGAGTLTLAGAATGYQAFSTIGDGNTTYYVISSPGAEWEVGIGTYTLSGTTLARTTILASSNSNSVVTLSAGTKDVMCIAPAAKSLLLDANGVVPIGPSLESMTISATAATGTINYDALTQSVLYYTSNAAANWTTNIRGSASVTLNNTMATGQALSVVFMVTQGGTPYYCNAFQIDTASVTPKWQGGTAPTSGNASSIDVYSYTIIKTGSAAFTVLASQTKFA